MAFKKVAFRSLSGDSEDFQLLFEGYSGTLVSFNSTNMQWTRLNHLLYLNCYMILNGAMFLIVTETRDRHEIFLISLREWGLVLVEICLGPECNSRSEGHFLCFKPSGWPVRLHFVSHENRFRKVFYTLVCVWHQLKMFYTLIVKYPFLPIKPFH